MEYNGTIYRPPVEAYTFLLPVTEGCTHNACSFCSMYQHIPFRVIKLDVIEKYLAQARKLYGRQSDQLDRIYLVGADPFALSVKKLDPIIDAIYKYFPAVKTISMYARVTNIQSKSDDDLKYLLSRGVNDLYIGIETGLDDVLTYLNKGNNAKEAREQVLRLNKIGMNHRDLLMLGAAGKGRGKEEALADAAIENELKPDMILINTMSVFPGTKLSQEVKEGHFILPGEKENLEEEKLFLEKLNLPNTYFWAAHPMDATPIAWVLGPNQKKMIEILEESINTIDETKYNRVYKENRI